MYGAAPPYRPTGGFFNEGYLGDAYPGQTDSFDDRSIEAKFAGVIHTSALDSSNGAATGASPSRHGRTSRPRPQLAGSATPTSGRYQGEHRGNGALTSDGLNSGTPTSGKYQGELRDSPRLADSSGTATGASSGASRTKRPRPKINEYI